MADGFLTEPQRRYVAELGGVLAGRSPSVRGHLATRPRRLAESRPWANFHPELKDLLVPVVVERSSGSRVWDAAGHEYIDYCMGFGVHLFGHGPEFVTAAVHRQLERTYSIGNQFGPTYELAEQFCRITGHDRVTFACTGTEAVMGALRLARLATGRHRIAYFGRSYHGLADQTLAAAGDHPDAPRAGAPGLSPAAVSEAVVLPYGDEAAIDWLKNASDVAAVLVEPIQNRNPSVQPAEFVRRLREVTAAAGIVLVFDEMITGFRLGLRGAQGWWGVTPDLATYGKILGGGLPIAAVAGRAALMDGMDGGSWRYGDDSRPATAVSVFGGTFQKHPLAVAAARAVLDHLESAGPDLYTDLNTRARQAGFGLNDVFAAAEVPLKVAAFGSVWRFEPTGPGGSEQALQADLLHHSLTAAGIYAWKGRSFFLSTAHTDQDTQRLIDTVERLIPRLRAAQFLPERPRRGASAAASLPA
jgi:glutamate-1-semialdehyde aminotransferase